MTKKFPGYFMAALTNPDTVLHLQKIADGLDKSNLQQIEAIDPSGDTQFFYIMSAQIGNIARAHSFIDVDKMSVFISEENVSDLGRKAAVVVDGFVIDDQFGFLRQKHREVEARMRPLRADDGVGQTLFKATDGNLFVLDASKK